MSNKTLIIIDMQDHFIDEEEEKIIPGICSLIRYARQQRWGIIVLEYRLCGKTIPTILKRVEGYELQSLIVKKDQDGGKEILDFLHKEPSWSRDLLVCGIYGDACVPSTVSGILELDDTMIVDVITDLVYPDYISMCDQEELITSDDIIKEENVCLS